MKLNKIWFKILNDAITYFVNFLKILSPWRVVDDCGGAFAMGAIGGAIFRGGKEFFFGAKVRYAHSSKFI